MLLSKVKPLQLQIMLQLCQFPHQRAITALVSFATSEVAISYLGMKIGPCTNLRKVLATHLYAKVGGEFEYCLQSVQSQPYRRFGVKTFE
jgi:chemotaxis protein CheY-P-specific phosphatase CheC